MLNIMLTMTFTLVMISGSLLMLLMSGLMVVWLSIRSLGLVLLGVVFMLMPLAKLGSLGGGSLGFASTFADGGGETCRLFCSIPGPLQTVQRAEILGCSGCPARMP